MKNILSCTLFLLSSALVSLTHAAPNYWAAAYTEAANADKSEGEQLGCYSGYYCTAETALDLFGGASIGYLTEYFVDNYDAGVQLLSDESAKYHGGAGAAGKLGLSLSEYDHGQYVLNSTYGDSLSPYGYGCLAVLLYENDSVREVRVMSGDLTEWDNGNAYFSDNDPTTSGGAGNWSAVPEPTSVLLLLLGMAGLSLRRRPCA